MQQGMLTNIVLQLSLRENEESSDVPNLHAQKLPKPDTQPEKFP